MTTFLRVWGESFGHVKIPANKRFSKCTLCIMANYLLDECYNPADLAYARAARDDHLNQVTIERRFLNEAILRSMRDPDFLFCEIDGMDSSKTLLPHFRQWDKDVNKDKLLQMHLTCVKYNGLQPDDVYLFTNCFPHDSSNTITTMYLTVLKELRRRQGQPLKEIWFQLDNTARENKNRFVMCFCHWLGDMGFARQIRLSFLPVG